MAQPLMEIMPDIQCLIMEDDLRDLIYKRQKSAQFPSLNLGLTLWQGTFEDKHDTWLRWTGGQEIADTLERLEFQPPTSR
jgi:hypothetical protein